MKLPLCMDCQSRYRRLRIKPTACAKKLFLDLKRRGFQVYIEYYDGHKTVDIFVKDAMVHIEVDGYQHNIDGNIAIQDLWRTYHSFKEGYFTLRIPNSAIYNDFNQTSKAVSNILEEYRNPK